MGPEPPKIMFIPPTPAEELERTLEVGPPDPPGHSGSHLQRRLSLVQRARRYSSNSISPFLTRASSNRGRYYSGSHARTHAQRPHTATPRSLQSTTKTEPSTVFGACAASATDSKTATQMMKTLSSPQVVIPASSRIPTQSHTHGAATACASDSQTASRALAVS